MYSHNTFVLVIIIINSQWPSTLPCYSMGLFETTNTTKVAW